MEGQETDEVVRVCWVPQIPMPAFKFAVPDIKTGLLLCDALAKYDLFQYENKVKPDYANTGWLDILTEEGWVSIDPDEPDDVEYAESILAVR